MLKTSEFKTHCKGDICSSKTANIIFPGLIGERPYVYEIVFKFKCIGECWLKQLPMSPNWITTSLVDVEISANLNS